MLRKEWIFRAVIFISATMITFGFGEIAVRILRPHLDLYELTGRIPYGKHPMSGWAIVDAFSAYRARAGKYDEGKTVSKQGFISTPDIPVDKPHNTIRIAFLGESSTAGVGKHNLKDEGTWPYQTVSMIRNKTSWQIDFINGALGGYTSFESYGRLWSRIRHFKPDIVIVCHGWNEMYYFGKVDNVVNLENTA